MIPLGALRRRGCSLAVCITAPFAFVGIFFALVLILVGSSALSRTINQESRLFSDEFGKRIAAYLAEFFRDPVQAGATTIERLATGNIDTPRLEAELIPKIRNYPWLSSIGVALPDGRFVAAARSPANASLLFFESGPAGAFRQLSRAIDGTHKPGALLALGHPYDPRKQEWYVEAVGRGSATWSQPYYISTLGAYGISLSTPLFDEKGALSAVIHGAVALPLMAQFLHENLPETSSLVLVVDRKGRLLASSKGLEDDNTLAPELAKAEASQDPLIAAAGTAMSHNRGAIDCFAAEGRNWRLAKQAFHGPLGLELDIGVVIEETRLAGPLKEFRDVATVLIVLSALAMMLAGYLIAKAISKPVIELDARAARLARGDWRPGPDSHAMATEIRQLSASFDTMAATLHDTLEGLETKVAERTASLDNLLREVNHRIKNTLNVAASLLALQGALSDSKETSEALDEAALRIKSMAILYSRLHLAADLENIELRSFIGAILDALAAGSIGPRPIRVERELVSASLPAKIASSVGIIVTELFTNACKYAFPEGREGVVTVRLDKVGTMLRIEVSDDGVGFPAGFDPANGGGFGLTVAGELAASMGGRLSIEARERGSLVALEIDLGAEGDSILSKPLR